MRIEQKQHPFQNLELNVDSDSCICEKKICALGIASIVIGIGGFILASIL